MSERTLDWSIVIPAVVAGICVLVLIVGPPLRWIGWTVVATVLILNGWAAWEFGIKSRIIRRRARKVETTK
jgi:hypothetical protein